MKAKQLSSVLQHPKKKMAVRRKGQLRAEEAEKIGSFVTEEKRIAGSDSTQSPKSIASHRVSEASSETGLAHFELAPRKSRS